MAKKKAAPRRKKAAAGSVGLAPADTRPGSNDLLARLARDVEADGGSVIGSYLDPFGGRGLLVAALPSPLKRNAGRPGPNMQRLASRIQSRVDREAQDAACVFNR